MAVAVGGFLCGKKFGLLLSDGSTQKPCVKAMGERGPYVNIDLGIAKLHFELGAGKDSFEWA